jgi:hypothetical protein
MSFSSLFLRAAIAIASSACTRRRRGATVGVSRGRAVSSELMSQGAFDPEYLFTRHHDTPEKRALEGRLK